MAENVAVSYEGLNEASLSLLSCASELSDLFDGIAQVTVSIGSNVTGFASIEDFVSKLEKINSTKDSLISKIKEFANYLPTVVASGYDDFIEAIGNIDIDLSSLATLIAMLSGTTLGGSSTAGVSTSGDDKMGDEAFGYPNGSSSNSDNTSNVSTEGSVSLGSSSGSDNTPSNTTDGDTSHDYSNVDPGFNGGQISNAGITGGNDKMGDEAFGYPNGSSSNSDNTSNVSTEGSVSLGSSSGSDNTPSNTTDGDTSHDYSNVDPGFSRGVHKMIDLNSLPVHYIN